VDEPVPRSRFDQLETRLAKKLFYVALKRIDALFARRRDGCDRAHDVPFR
jgi:hypothetical protein